MDLWICGRIWSGEQLVSILEDEEENDLFPWKLVGVFAKREIAEQHCTTPEHFLFRAVLGQDLGGIIEIDYPGRLKNKKK